MLKKVHFVGIGGIGVSAIAKMMFSQSVQVTGSEVIKSEITDELEDKGIKIFYDHSAGNLGEHLDTLIYSAAVREDNPERKEARKRGIREISYFDFLGELSRDYFTIAVSGTNGKSTTTAMLGLILEAAGLDPTVIVGSKVKTFPNGNLRMGRSKYLIVEACEYMAHMLKLSPQMIVLTNIEEDHLDYYRDLGHIKEIFAEYIQKLPGNGTLIYNFDDPATNEISLKFQPPRLKLSYGIDARTDYMIRNVFVDSERQYFNIVHNNINEEPIGNFSLQIPGLFNIYNAIAAATAAFNLNIDIEYIKKALGNFSGIWRRFEILGEHNGALIISDYGHHPTAISATVKAAREFYPKRRIVLIFQPHQRNRTRKLFNDFVKVLKSPDALILSEIYDVAGREANEDRDVSAKTIFEELKNIGKEVYFAKNLEETEDLAKKNMRKGDVYIIMGAGNIDSVARDLASKL